jgi:hypothetical protein
MVYSERNRKAKYAPEYSVLNPETNSDSDSLKSKGARWVSAKMQTNHIKKKYRYNKEEEEDRPLILKDKDKKQNIIIKVLRTAS